MNDQQPRQRFPSWKQALLILAGGVVLALSSCAAFLGTINSSDKLAVVFTAGFFLGVGVTVLGMILILVRAIRGPGSRGAQAKVEEQRD